MAQVHAHVQKVEVQVDLQVEVQVRVQVPVQVQVQVQVLLPYVHSWRQHYLSPASLTPPGPLSASWSQENPPR